jgi:hypothetical protein
MGSANPTNTLAGMLLLNDKNMADIYPNAVLDESPVIMKAFAVPASQGGTTHKFLRRTTAAGAGFRDLQSGVSNAAEKFDDITVNCEILDASFDRDVMLADAYAKGRDAYIEKATLAGLKSGMFKLEQAIFTNVADGFNGLLQSDDYSITGGTQVINAGGGSGKSVWVLRWGEEDLAVIAGNNGNMSMLWDNDNPTVVRMTDSWGKAYSAYRVTLAGYFGLQIGSKYCAARICNLDGTSDDLLTDDLIGEAMSKFPASRPPNMIVMNRTALQELRASRTATNPTGAPAPFPFEAFGVQIVVTDALPDDEAAVNATTTATTHTATSSSTALV